MYRRFSLKFVSVFVSFALVCVAALPQGQGTSKAPAAGSTQKSPPAAAATTQMDINSATKKELMTLPGIGDVLSQKIIDGRPYRAKNELTQKKIIPDATYAKISDLIIAKQGTAPAASSPSDSKGSKTAPATPAAPSTPSKSPSTPTKGGK